MSKTPGRRGVTWLLVAAIAAAGCGSNAPTARDAEGDGVSDTTT